MRNYLIITGGSRGIGEQTILKFMKDGWHTINLSRSPATIDKVKNISVDLASPNNVLNCRAELLAVIDGAEKICLVHNAAFCKPDALESISLANLQTSFDMNIVAAVILNQLLIPHMKAGSSIIYIGSTLAEKAVPGNASYIITKHALVALMKVTCQDLKGKDIHTVCINPGLVDTDLLQQVMTPERIKFLLENIVIGKRLIQPEEIANVIHFFANTNVVNGVSIAANTGQVSD